MFKEEYRKIILCPKCQGKGETEIRVSAYDTELEDCSYCNGKGRVRETIIKTHDLMCKKGEK